MLPEDETPSRRCAAEATTSLTQGGWTRAWLDRARAWLSRPPVIAGSDTYPD